jgi:hypothetical protein
MKGLGWIALPASLAVGGCAVTAPVAVIGPRGEILKGTATSTMTSGTVEATNGKLTCAGNFDPAPGSRSVTVAVKCSDGRVGIGTALRETKTSGRGIIVLNDGSRAQFIFGAGAAAF